MEVKVISFLSDVLDGGAPFGGVRRLRLHPALSSFVGNLSS